MDIMKRNLPSKDLSNPSKKARQVSPIKGAINNDFSTEDYTKFFEDDFNFIDETDNKENNSENSQGSKNLQQLQLTKWQRCRVLSNHRDPKNFDLILYLESEDKISSGICRLQGPWCYTKVQENDLVSVHGIWSSDHNCYLVNVANGYIITNPDFLISGTSVVGSLFCRRRGVLQDKFRGLDAENKTMTVGSIIHELLQSVLAQKLKTYEEIENAGKAILNTPEGMFTLYSSRMSVHEAEEEIQRFLPNIVDFVDQYISAKQVKHENKEAFAGTIDSIQDIEENLWIPQLGLKGKIDVSVKVKKNDLNNKQKKYMPLELKTGAASFSSEHKGQLILYQMMLSEIGQDVESGLLLYLRSGLMKEISATRNEKRDLIILRNDLAYYLNRKMKVKSGECTNRDLNELETKFENLELPEPINHHSACGKCPYNTICCSFLRADNSQNSLPPNHHLQKVFKQCTAYLKKSHFEYFIHWSGILSLEEQEIKNSNSIKGLWTESPEERSSSGKAIINLKISGEVRFEEGRYIHTLKTEQTEEANGTQTQIDNSLDLKISGFSIGEYVIVSTTKRIAVASGFVYDLTKSTIILRLERNLSKNYSTGSFIVDKHESQSGNIFNFTNLGVLLDETESRLRQIVVDKIKPTFSKVLPKVIANDGINILAQLNHVQRKAVMKALTANEYMLIKGLPGTGKTQTLVTIIRLLNMMGKSVLITSHTHSAVDNVLLRLKLHNLKFIRLGSNARILTQLHEYSESCLIKDCKTPQQLHEIYSSYNIVGVTCLGASHSIFINRKFDVCIVDEATQVFQPTVLRPLFYAQKFILVGDPEQLPPLVRSREGRNLGADESLFQRLDSEDSTFILTLQYRMNRCITKLANELTYDGKLICANDKVTLGSLHVPQKSKVLEIYKTEKWLLRALEKHVDFSVIFLDTLNCFERSCEFGKSQISDPSQIIEVRFSQETSSKKLNRKFKYTNYCDGAVAIKIVRALVSAGCSAGNIGIIAPYRAQVELLRKLFEDLQNFNKEQNVDFSGLEVNTVDQYQGRDKEVIIYSCTKTGISDISKENEILEDRRRLTVAITRSKHKLIIIGDEECLKSYTPLKDLLEKIPSRCKIKLKDDDELGFSWNKTLEDLREIICE